MVDPAVVGTADFEILGKVQEVTDVDEDEVELEKFEEGSVGCTEGMEGVVVELEGVAVVLERFTAELAEFTAELAEFTAELAEFTAELEEFTAELEEFTAELEEFIAELTTEAGSEKGDANNIGTVDGLLNCVRIFRFRSRKETKSVKTVFRVFHRESYSCNHVPA